MERPNEIQDEDYKRTWGRVDVAEATGVVCTRVEDEDRPRILRWMTVPVGR